MSNLTQINFTTPVGRFIGGSMYEGDPNDYEGRPKFYKSGQNQGKPRTDWSFGIAVKKGNETHWASAETTLATGQVEKWGEKIWQAGHNFQGNAGANPDFAWKIQDGDSQVPGKPGKDGKPGRKPCEREGYPGCWVIWFSKPNIPNVYDLVGRQAPEKVTQVGEVMPGDYIQVNGSAVGNDSTGNPGVFLNHESVCRIAFGPRISTGMDVNAVGFGAVGALPAGASMVPLAGAAMPAPPAAAAPAAAPPPPPPRAALPPPPAAAPLNVAPNPAFSAAAVGATPPPPPPPPAAAPAPVAIAYAVAPAMAAQGHTLESLRASGQTDAQMAAAGWLVVAAPAAPPPPPPMPAPAAAAGPSKRMTPAAHGHSYDSLIATGQWTDALLVQQGLMEP